MGADVLYNLGFGWTIPDGRLKTYHRAQGRLSPHSAWGFEIGPTISTLWLFFLKIGQSIEYGYHNEIIYKQAYYFYSYYLNVWIAGVCYSSINKHIIFIVII